MYSFFKNKEYALWAWGGGALITLSLWYQVSVSKAINVWFGEFYDLIQKYLAKEEGLTPDMYWNLMWQFGTIAGIFIIVAVLTDFFTQHYTFRWRKSMTEHYLAHWESLGIMEGASQRVQEDTAKFARIIEDLGVGLIRAAMTLFAFIPILWGLSKAITIVPYFGEVPHALVIGALIFALAGTIGLAILGYRLPGLEYKNQVVEAAFRKELVRREDDHIEPDTAYLWKALTSNYFKLYFNYMYFGVGKWSYLQFGVLVPYIIMGPTIIGGLLTFGAMQQTVRAFGQVESSLQYLVNSWTTIVEALSIHKRLREFEQEILR